MTKYFYESCQREGSPGKVLEKSAEQAMEIFETKRKYIPKLRNKLEDPNTAPEMYWNISKSSVLY